MQKHTVVLGLYLRLHWGWKLLGSKESQSSSILWILCTQGIPIPMVKVFEQASVGSSLESLAYWSTHILIANEEMPPRSGRNDFGKLTTVLILSFPINSWNWFSWLLTAWDKELKTESKSPVELLMKFFRNACWDSTLEVLRFWRYGCWQAQATKNSSLTGRIFFLGNCGLWFEWWEGPSDFLNWYWIRLLFLQKWLAARAR